MSFEMGRTFISYSRKDRDFTLKVAKDLRKAGADIWLDQLDIPAGENWDDAIEAALDSCDSLMVILSPISIKSKNVKDELSFALAEEKRIIPVLYKKCRIPLRIHRLNYVDFTNGYDPGFSALVRAFNLRLPSQ